MRFTVPQFIEREAKVIGPFTFKQAIIMGGDLLVAVILYFILPPALFILALIIITGTTVGLIFLKIEGKSLPVLFIGLLKFKMSPKTYMWQNDGRDIETFSREGVAIGEINFGNPEQIKKIEETNLNKLSQKH